MTEAELAYAAGIIDGEGCIFVGNRSGKNQRPHYILKVEVGSTTPALTEWLNEKFGGHLSPITKKKEWRPAQRWTLSSAAAGGFLKAIRPYLLIKADQADLAIEFQSTKGLHLTGRTPAPPEKLERELEFCLRLRELKAA